MLQASYTDALVLTAALYMCSSLDTCIPAFNLPSGICAWLPDVHRTLAHCRVRDCSTVRRALGQKLHLFLVHLVMVSLQPRILMQLDR